MSQILLMLLEHPLTTGFLVLCALGFVRLTYDFILRLFGRKGFPNVLEGGNKEDTPPKEEPPEDSNVDNPDGPDDILEVEAGTPVEEYIHNPDWNKDGLQDGLHDGWTTDYEK